MQSRYRVAVLAGGFSGEFAVSMKSAATIMSHMDTERFEPYLVELNRTAWLVQDGEDSISLDLNDFGFLRGDEKLIFDYAFIMVHGSPGEDGKLQGYLEMKGIPYSTGSLRSMSMTFNKAVTQQMVAQHQVPIAGHIIFTASSRPENNVILDKVGLPCFVKPTESGSSIGVTMVKDASDLDKAIHHALEVYHEVIVESYLDGRELACGVYRVGDEVKALPVTEISSEREFFDYTAKYEDLATQEITPAPIPEGDYIQCQAYAKQVYALFQCNGIARADFFLCKDGLFFVEINTVPGMSAESLVPKQLHTAEIDLKTLLTESIEADIKKHNER